MTSFKTPKGTELPLFQVQRSKKNKDGTWQKLDPQPYLQVPYRVQWFREEHPDWSIETEIIELGPSSSVVKGLIKNAEGRIMAMAHKREDKADFNDHLEKAETSAIGRALALCGYGTQFALDLNEEERLADSPLDKGVPNEPRQPNRAAPAGAQTNGPATGVYHQSTAGAGGFDEAEPIPDFASFDQLSTTPPSQAQNQGSTQGTSSGLKEQGDGSLTLKMKGFDEPVTFEDAWAKYRAKAINLAVFFKANSEKGEKVAGKLRQFVNYGHARGFVDFGL